MWQHKRVAQTAYGLCCTESDKATYIGKLTSKFAARTTSRCSCQRTEHRNHRTTRNEMKITPFKQTADLTQDPAERLPQLAAHRYISGYSS